MAPETKARDEVELDLQCSDPGCAHIYTVPEVEYDPGDEFQHTCPSCHQPTGEIEAED